MILNHNKIAIMGYARTGKTRCSELFVDRMVFHTDEFLSKSYGDVLIKAYHLDRWLIEGVDVSRMLRSNEIEPDLVIRLDPKFDAEPKHRAQRKAIDTVWGQWLAQKPECEIMRVNEDVLEFMIETEKALYGVKMIQGTETWNKTKPIPGAPLRRNVEKNEQWKVY